MSPILARASSNFLGRHISQLILTILSIALGVAVVVSVDLAKNSALESFSRAVQAVTGHATHRIVGGPKGLSEQLYKKLRLSEDIGFLAPRVEGLARIGDESSTIVRILGVDPVSEGDFQSDWYTDLGSKHSEIDLTRLMVVPSTVIVTDDMAKHLTVKNWESFDVLIGTTRKPVVVSAVMSSQSSSSGTALNNLLITDISTAQELLGVVGRLSYIDLILDDIPNKQGMLNKIKKILPENVELIIQGSGQRSVQEMTRAFYTNLTALSMLSLVVGMFLIFNTMTFLVVQRRELMGGLRALGVTGRQIFWLILSEAALIGVLGTVVGLLVGTGLSHIFLELISTTLNQAYSFLTSPQINISLFILAKGALLGIGSTIVSAIIPAKDAARYSPLQVMRRSQLELNTRATLFNKTIIGTLSLAIGFITLIIPSKSIELGFVSQLFVVLGFALLTPILTVLMMEFIRPTLARKFGVIGYLPIRFITASLSRTGIAIAALMVAIATSNGIELMVGSFRISVLQWLDSRLDAEIYISNSVPTSIGFARSLVQQVKDISGVKAVSTVYRLKITRQGVTTRINAYQMAPISFAGFHFTEGISDQIWKVFEEEDVVIVTEAYSYLHDIKVGHELMLRTERGDRAFRVIGVYRDYNSGVGIVSMSRKTFDKYWSDESCSGIWVYTVKGIDLNVVRTAIENIGDISQLLEITEQKRIVELSMEIFDQAFAITQVLKWLATTIAFVGVFSALMALELERTWEYGVLRAIGITPSQLRIVVYTETGFMGFIAGILALPLSCLIAWILIFVINQRSFGWSMDFVLDWSVLAQGLVLSLSAALLAGIYPARKLSKLNPVDALRAE